MSVAFKYFCDRLHASSTTVMLIMTKTVRLLDETQRNSPPVTRQRRKEGKNGGVSLFLLRFFCSSLLSFFPYCLRQWTPGRYLVDNEILVQNTLIIKGKSW